MRYELGFVGAGNMAEAIVGAAIGTGLVQPGQVIASDPAEARRRLFANLGVATVTDNAEVIGQSKQVMLAVKPQKVTELIGELAACASAEQVFISIVTGVRIAKWNQWIVEAGGKPLRIVRVMPNTPVLVGQGMAAIAVGDGSRAGDETLAMKLFSAGGRAIRVHEDLLDAVTAVSGSGPAYVFYLAEAMQKAAADLGLGEHARLLVGQTILGAAHLLLESLDTPAELRRKVTSPGGTTEAAVRRLDASRTMQVLIEAVGESAKRSQELGQ